MVLFENDDQLHLSMLVYLVFLSTYNTYLFTEENQEIQRSVLVKIGKDPTVETGFLPDRYGIYLVAFAGNVKEAI